MIKAKNTLEGKLNASIVKEYPELEEITITPTLDGQELESNKYGYSKITVEGIPAIDISIEPTTEEQIKTGIFKKVKVEAVQGETLDIIPTEQSQAKTGIFTQVNINPIQVEEITTDLDFSSSDAIELTAQEGAYIKKATINKPMNLKPENIKSGETVCGIDGINADTSDADATSEDITAGKTAYVNNQKVIGTMEANENNAMIEGQLSEGTNNGSQLFRLVKKIPEDITIKGTSAGFMFYGCTSLTTIPLLDTSKVTEMYSMFYNCTSLTTIPLLDTSNVLYMNTMFYDCTSLTTIPLLDTSKVRNMNSMFYNCTSLTTIPLLDMSNVTSALNGMFNDCKNLTTVPLLNISKTIETYNMFKNCSSLSEESLNNILAMLANATSITNTSYKTLKYTGLSSAQATVCQGLSNYQAFLNAGWTTGY